MENTVHVRYFAGLRELLGVEAEEIKISSSSVKLGEFLNRIVELHPEIKTRLKAAAVAINLEVDNSKEQKIRVGDEIAFMPPVGGG